MKNNKALYPQLKLNTLYTTAAHFNMALTLLQHLGYLACNFAGFEYQHNKLGLRIINGGKCWGGGKGGGRNSSVGIITRLQAGLTRRGSSIPNRGKSFTHLQTDNVGSAAQRAYYSLGTGALPRE